MERVRRFERPTSTLARLRSTPELHPHPADNEQRTGNLDKNATFSTKNLQITLEALRWGAYPWRPTECSWKQHDEDLWKQTRRNHH